MALAAALAACGAKDKETDGEEFLLPSRSETVTETAPPETLAPIETQSAAMSYPWETESGQPQTEQPNDPQTQAQTQPGTPTTVRPGTARPTTPQTRAQTTTRTSTTKKPPTTKQNFANPITISSAEGALSAFNKATQTVVSKRPGFAKNHMVTYKDWQLDPSAEAVLTFPIVGDYSKTFTDQLSKILSSGARSASAYKGDPQEILKDKAFSMSDMKSVSYSRDGSDWLVTLNVKDGSTRQEKRFLGNGVTGNSPIDNGPLALAMGSSGIYDHMTADRIFTLILNNPAMGLVSIEPIDIKESTSQVKFLARLDGEGKLIGLTVTYNQIVNLADIHIMDGTSYKNNEGSASVRIVFEDFAY